MSAVKIDANLGPKFGQGFAGAQHKYALVNIDAFKVDFVHARKISLSDDHQHPKRLLFIHKEEQEPGKKVETLAVSNLGLIYRE